MESVLSQATECASLAAIAWLSARILWAIRSRGGRGRPSPGESADLAASELRYLRRWFRRDRELSLSLGALVVCTALFFLEVHSALRFVWLAVSLSIFPATLLFYGLRPDLRILAEADRAEGREGPQRGRTFSALYRNAQAYRSLPQGERFRREMEARLVNFDPWRAASFPARRTLASVAGALPLLLILWGTARIWPSPEPAGPPEKIARAEEPAKKSAPPEKNPEKKPETKPPAEIKPSEIKPKERRPDNKRVNIENEPEEPEQKVRAAEEVADGPKAEPPSPPTASPAVRDDPKPDRKGERSPGELAATPEKKESAPEKDGTGQKGSETAKRSTGSDGKRPAAPGKTAVAQKGVESPKTPADRKGAPGERPPAAAGKETPKSAADCAHSECTEERKRGGA